jgi:hypothetical protein
MSVIGRRASRSPPPRAGAGAQNVRRAHSVRTGAATGGRGGRRPHSAVRGPAASPFRFCGGSNPKALGDRDKRGVFGPGPRPRPASRARVSRPSATPSLDRLRTRPRPTRLRRLSRLCWRWAPRPCLSSGIPCVAAPPGRPGGRSLGNIGGSARLRPGNYSPVRPTEAGAPCSPRDCGRPLTIKIRSATATIDR